MITWKNVGQNEALGFDRDGRQRIVLSWASGRWDALIYLPGSTTPVQKRMTCRTLPNAQDEAAGEYDKLLRWR